MTHSVMKALTLDLEQQSFKLETEYPKPELPPGGALLRLEGCGLCGSDVDKLRHHKAPTGTVLGHEVVGVLEAFHPSYAGPFQLGERVISSHHVPCGKCQYCLNGSEPMCRQFKATNLNPGGFAEYITLSADHLAHTCFRVPNHISSREAICVEPLACVHRGLRRLPPLSNPSAVVLGLGFLGLLSAQLLKLKGFKVLGVDRLPERLHLAEVAGYCDSAYQAAPPPAQAQSQQAVRDAFLQQHTQGMGQVDVVVLSAVTPATVALALELVRDGGTLLVLSASPETTFDSQTLYFREITVLPSYSPCLEDLQAAAKLVFTRQVSLTPLITHPVPLEQAHEGLQAYMNTEAVKVYFEFSSPASGH